jgi:shikimate kinase
MRQHSLAVRHVVLVGLMGAGKTTVGRRLAARLDWPWHDSDAEIEAATGLTVRQLRDRAGAEAMHDLEAAQLLGAIAEPGPSVVSAAASVIDSEDCRQAMADPGIAVVWLRATPAVLATRFPAGDHRPAFGASPEAFLAEQSARREPLLQALDPIVIDVDHIDPEAVVARTLEALG